MPALPFKNDEKTIRAWAMFDWANSAYNLVITSTIFPSYYAAITADPGHGNKVSFFGFTFVNTALSSYSLSVAYLVMAVILPVLSSVADNKGNKKAFMKAFTYIGSIACMGLFFFTRETLELGIICSSLAAMGYIGGVLFNNSYLPEIASVEQQDKASARGFAYGYVGSVILQLICFVFVLMPGRFGLTAQSSAQLSFLLVGLWWIGFAQIPFRKLPESTPNLSRSRNDFLKDGFIELGKVWKQIRTMPMLKRFLIAFFFYGMGVQTVMLMAVYFGVTELGLQTGQLIATILVIQLVAIAGAWLMSVFAAKYGNINVLIAVVIIWILMCIAAYYTYTVNQFYGLAVIVGLIMGGIQSLSRSTYSKLIPEATHDTASFFSFYDVTEKVAIVIGLASFGYIVTITSIRITSLALLVFFILGLVFLFAVPKRGMPNAGRDVA
jgi:UMF1 family MFS transporter